jgi:N-acetylneuraminic acid mutarotase
MREPAPGRPSARMGLAAGRGRRSRASLAVLSLSLGATVSLSGVIEAAGLEREGQARPRPRWAHSAAVVDGRIYVIGGAGADNQVAGSVEAFDPAKGTWSACADMPTARALLGVGVIGGRIYTVGGTTMGLDKLATVEVYDPTTDTWARKADMPTARNTLSAIAVDGKLYAIGGGGFDRPESGWESFDAAVDSRDFSRVEVYDPETDRWAAREDMPTARSALTLSAVGGRIYAIGGGFRRGGRDVSLSLVEVYDTGTNRWTRTVDMPTPRFFPVSSVIDGRIWVAGGVSQEPASTQEERMRKRAPLSVVEVYDPARGRWTTEAALATARGWFSASIVDGRIYVFGGRAPAPDGGILESSGALPGIEVYTPAH